ncbi:MAG: heme lyase CcmF/NrfE family subunit, partial [Caldilineae bacterium]
MADLGFISLNLALLVTLYGIVVSLVGARRSDVKLTTSGRNALFVAGGLVTIATLALWYLLLTNDFSIDYVASHTERNLPLFYRFSSLWGGQDGSLLFWAFILVIYSTVFVGFEWKRHPVRAPYMVATLLAVLLFFLVIVLAATNPFKRLWVLPDGSTTSAMFKPAGASLFIPADGNGLNPLLQNYWMVVHPVALYLGYVGLTLPMAFAVASLATGRLDNR